MKRISLITILLFALLLASCGGTADSASTTTVNSDAYVSPNLDVSYENALSARLQLTLGSLKLAERETPITAEQAQVMLPLWEGLLNMTRTGNNAQAEVNALLGQIEAAFNVARSARHQTGRRRRHEWKRRQRRIHCHARCPDQLFAGIGAIIGSATYYLALPKE